MGYSGWLQGELILGCKNLVNGYYKEENPGHVNSVVNLLKTIQDNLKSSKSVVVQVEGLVKCILLQHLREIEKLVEKDSSLDDDVYRLRSGLRYSNFTIQCLVPSTE